MGKQYGIMRVENADVGLCMDYSLKPTGQRTNTTKRDGISTIAILWGQDGR